MHLLQTEFFAPNTWPVAAESSSAPQNYQRRTAARAQANSNGLSPADNEILEPPERVEFLQFSAPHFEAVSNNLLNLYVSEAPSHWSHYGAGAGGNGATSVSLFGDYKSRSDSAYLSALPTGGQHPRGISRLLGPT